MAESPRFNVNADAALNELYENVGAKTTEHKINALKPHLDGDGEWNFYAVGGEVNQEMILGCLEYEYLSSRGLIELTLA